MPDLRQYLEELDTGLQRQGYPSLDETSLREVAKHLNHPDVMQGLQSGRITTQQILQEVETALGAHGQTPPFAVEGGLIGDSAGQQSALLKSRGYQVGP